MNDFVNVYLLYHGYVASLIYSKLALCWDVLSGFLIVCLP